MTVTIRRLLAAALTVSAICLAQNTSVSRDKDAPKLNAQAEAQSPAELPTLTVTATRTEIPAAQLANTFTVITRKELDLSEQQSLADVLRDISGLGLKSSGPYDSNAQISIRGMSSYHTKLLIDNVPFMDNSSTRSLPIIGNLMLDDVERIEVLKGAISLQGTSAMGGVINVVTRCPTEEGIHARINFEAGSHARFNTSAAIYGKYDPVDFKIALARSRERGISVVATDPYGNINDDNDHYRNQAALAFVGLQLDEHWRLSLNGSFQYIDEEYDSGYLYDDWYTGDTVLVADQDDVWLRRTLGSAKIEGKELFNGQLDSSLLYALSRADRNHMNADYAEYRYIGDTSFLSWQSTWHINDTNDLIAGLERQTEQSRNFSFSKKSLDKQHRTVAAFTGYKLEPFNNLFISLNGRYSYHSEFNGEWTGDAAAKYYFENTGTTIKASTGKGYRSPSVYELFAPANAWGFLGGNPDLKPETSYTWEAGLEQELLDKKLTLGTTYFENNVDDFISATAISHEQIDGVAIRGIESFVTYNPCEQFNIKLSYIYQRARDIESGNKHIAYIPRHKATINASWHPLENKKLALNLGGAWTGPRWNASNADAVSRSRLDDFLLLHTAVTYQITENIKAYARIENLLNTNYTLADDYGTRYNTYGRCCYLGLTVTF